MSNAMSKPRLLAAVALTLAGATAATAAITACTDPQDRVEATDPPDGSADGTARDGEGPGDQDADDGDAGTTGDAGKDAKAPRDANGPGEAGDDCFYNYDCALALRCSACDAGYCVCEQGTRGTGQNGVDPCTGNDECASALCVEEICSDECEGDDDCTPALPRCLSIGFTKICSPPAK
jgi:hypothetical protein